MECRLLKKKEIGTSLFSDLVSIFVNIHSRPTPECKLFYKELFSCNPCYIWVTKPTEAVAVEAVFSKSQLRVSSCEEARSFQGFLLPGGQQRRRGSRLRLPAHAAAKSPAPAAVPTGAGWELGLSLAWAQPDPACSLAAP